MPTLGDAPPRARNGTWAAQIPNVLTLARVAAIPVIVALLYWPQPQARLATLGLFLLASLTDWLDGWLARRLDVRSRFGTMLDPIADKLIVAAILVMLVAERAIAGPDVIAVLLILGREIFVSGLREYLAGERIQVPVTGLAKWKTALQMAAIAGVLCFAGAGGLEERAARALLWAAALLSVYTGFVYARAFRPNPPPGASPPG